VEVQQELQELTVLKEHKVHKEAEVQQELKEL
jgi:hypothetical protein